MDYKKVAQDVIAAIGADNLQAAAHCATRLRLVVKDESKINQSALDNDPDIKGTFKTNGQFQVIIGPGAVDYVYAELIKQTGLKEVTPDDLKEAASHGQKTNPLMAFIKLLSDIFVPIVPALVAGGLLMALNNVLTAENLFAAKSLVEMYPQIKGVSEMVNLMASAPFTFLPILIGFSATRRFGGNPYLGAAMGMIMVMPSLVNGYSVAVAMSTGKMAYWNLFGFKVAQAGYQGQVIPVLAVAYILATLEKFFHRHISDALDFTFTPMLSIVITGFLTFIVVGPILRAVSDGLTNGLVWLYNTTGFIGTGIFGTFYSSIVITGLHQSFPVVETQLLANIAKTGGSFIFPIASMANVAQAGACLAIFFMTKSEKEKGLTSSSGISALLGITEPAIFAVNLKLKFPFVCAMIGSGIASAWLGLNHVLASAMGSAGLIGFISIPTKYWVPFLTGIAVSFGITFALTVIYGKRNMDWDSADEKEASSELEDSIVLAPVSGQVESLKEVKDQVFSAEIMGKGAAIIPTDDQVYAPIDGVVTVVFETHHAYGITGDNGTEVLIHLGLDTVNLKGQYFTSNVEKRQKVKAGDLLGTFDYQKIQSAGYDSTVMVVVTNTMSYGAVERVEKEQVSTGEELIALTAANINGSGAMASSI
ncbi:sucrose-specific PTS transporter subunit IIBC [Xylocopilactobacillus apicola]|uniref:protein-N(pi)-phosphohistidine--sucrose phosphotransferase n=1 Tax=Xylocopilactobacillus apicola TaxID=2932184 RepID=A0AAU9DS95_9LACO|nr:sucrose-specific PTS transporter subunit IIBC [Xylocopilactobacillus apicola]BDR58879.1 PTS beta-glucoside transporter subunit EIIBCA [Xylocopilactobacillus apicola]